MLYVINKCWLIIFTLLLSSLSCW